MPTINMKVEFDLQDFIEGDPAEDTRDKLLDRVHRLAQVFAQAFQAQVTWKLTPEEDWVIYEVMVDQSRAHAVRELLEWITTTNVAFEETVMKYIRVVMAVNEQDLPKFAEQLDVFIEESEYVQGAYVSVPYDSREEGINAPWRNK